MDPVTGAALIAGGSSLLGGIMGNNSAKKAAKTANEFSERMANSVHQREVIDLRAAGLNPMLSVMGGNGAPAPSGQIASVRDAVTPATNSALAARQNNAQIKLLEEQAALAKQQNFKAAVDTGTSMSQGNLYTEQANKTKAETAILNANAPERETKGMMWDTLKKALTPAKQLFDGDYSAKSLLPPPSK